VIVCAGQTPLRSLHDELQARGVASQLVGGAFEAAELDAKRAIDQASRLAADI
jgi:2,4-dienoyl-CoA reductase (NADPH2)